VTYRCDVQLWRGANYGKVYLFFWGLGTGASNRVARIPFPMTEDDFELLMGTLNLWKKKLVSPKSDHPDAKSQASNAADES
jgi:hypothetical protein